MSSYLAIDPGLSHIGFATSDSTHLVQLLDTVRVKDPSQIVPQILLTVRRQNPDYIVIGQPSFGPIRSLSQDLFDALKQEFKGKVYLSPEDLSSKIAVQKLIQSGTSQQNRRNKKHAAAAAVILQDFLDS